MGVLAQIRSCQRNGARDANQYPQAQSNRNRCRDRGNEAARCVKWEMQNDCPGGTSEYADGTAQIPIDEEVYLKSWSVTPYASETKMATSASRLLFRSIKTVTVVQKEILARQHPLLLRTSGKQGPSVRKKKKNWRETLIPRSLQIHWDPLIKNAHVQNAGPMVKTQVQKRTVRDKSQDCVRHCSCCIRAWYTVSLTMAWVSQRCHSPACWSSTGCKSKPWQSSLIQEGHIHWGHTILAGPATHWKKDKVEQVKSVSQCDEESKQATQRYGQKQERGVDRQLVSHKWAKQSK